MYEDFEVRWEGLLAGDPEQVWDAITVNAIGWSWDIEYEPRVGGADRGLTSAGGAVPAWAPPRRFATRAERPDGWANQLDYALEPADGGTQLRFTHRTRARAATLAPERDACERHTAFYYHSLGEYVEQFAGRRARYVELEAPGSFADVVRRLGVPEGATAGDSVTLAPGARGTVDYAQAPFLGVRTDDALIRVYGREAWGGPVSVVLHLFDPQADLGGVERAFRTALAAETEEVA